MNRVWWNEILIRVFFYVRGPPIHFCVAWWLTWFFYFSVGSILWFCVHFVFFTQSLSLSLSLSLSTSSCFGLLFLLWFWILPLWKNVHENHIHRALNIQTKCLDIPQLKICNNTTICSQIPFGLFSIVWVSVCVRICMYLCTYYMLCMYRMAHFFFHSVFSILNW